MSLKFKNLSHEAVIELLFYLAENEEFPSLKGLRNFTVEEVSNILKEIANGLKDEMMSELPAQKSDLGGYDFSSQAQSLISALSPREEMILFKSFKLI